MITGFMDVHDYRHLIVITISTETSVTEEPREGKLHAGICAGVPGDRHSYRDCFLCSAAWVLSRDSL
jgi:hypothetical protein